MKLGDKLRKAVEESRRKQEEWNIHVREEQSRYAREEAEEQWPALKLTIEVRLEDSVRFGRDSVVALMASSGVKFNETERNLAAKIWNWCREEKLKYIHNTGYGPHGDDYMGTPESVSIGLYDR